jgi:hypothetical protein
MDGWMGIKLGLRDCLVQSKKVKKSIFFVKRPNLAKFSTMPELDKMSQFLKGCLDKKYI